VVDFEEDFQKKTDDDVDAIRKALETNAKWFAPITVKIQSLEATAKDSKGREYEISIVTTPNN
jgi:hypothetical protein